MWSMQSEELAGARGMRVTVAVDSHPATSAEVIAAWQGDSAFRSQFNAFLAGSLYAAFRWETPAVTADTVTRPFEFVLLDSPGLERRSDPEAFAEHFGGAEDDVAVFPNLGRDTILIVPCPVADWSAYGHVAAFVRKAPKAQQDALWRTVGEQMARRVGANAVWLSTAGAGVPWLHVRLDNRPKYYRFAPYREHALPSAEDSGPTGKRSAGSHGDVHA